MICDSNTVDMIVMSDSPLKGKTVEKAGLRHLPDLYLATIERESQTLSAVGPNTQLQGGDQLRFVGVVDSILDLQRIKGLQTATDEVFKLEGLRKDRSLIEAVVSNTCPIIGQTIRESQFRTQYNAVVVAAARNGDRLTGKIGEHSASARRYAAARSLLRLHQQAPHFARLLSGQQYSKL